MSLKRPYSTTSQASVSSESMSTIPPIPKISGEIILETFTHKSLRFDGDEFGDNQRLSELGDKVLQLAITNILYNKRPVIKAADIPAERDKLLSSENVDRWVAQYGLRGKLRFAPALDTIDSDEETRSLFSAYVGAVFAQSGMRQIADWIGHLVCSDSDQIPFSPEDTGASSTFDHEDRPNKKVKNEPIPPDVPPPPVPSGPLTFASSPSSYAQQPLPPTNAANTQQAGTTAFLPLFNMTCAQKKFSVEYQAEFQGPPHAGRWNIKCIVNGIIKGQGQGVSKQLAKEEAAKQAFYGMGFGGFGEKFALVQVGPPHLTVMGKKFQA